MKYLCLVYGEENKIATMDDHECLACDADLRASGHCIASEALEAVATAATVRIRNGRLSISDGPFAETKELIAGYAILQFTSKAEAIEWTKRFVQVDAPLRLGGESECEIRPFFEFEDFGPSEAIERFREMRVGTRK